MSKKCGQVSLLLHLVSIVAHFKFLLIRIESEPVNNNEEQTLIKDDYVLQPQ